MSTTKTPIEIALATDSNYLVPVTVTITSIFDSNQGEDIVINLLHLESATKPEDVDWIENYINRLGGKMRRLAVTDEMLGGVPELRHTKSTYLRLLLPLVAPSIVERVIYLDADLVVTRSLAELYATNIDGCYVAAVKEMGNIFEREHMKNIGIDDNGFYFGAGVLLMNLSKMRADNVVPQFYKFISEHPEHIKWSDQDVLNATLWRHVNYLPPKYNFNFLCERDVPYKLWTRDEVHEVLHHPVVIHYMGGVKPWRYISVHPKRAEWWKYLQKSPFAGYAPKDKSIKNFFRRIRLYLLFLLKKNIPLDFKVKMGKYVPGFIKNRLKKQLAKPN